MPGALGPVQTVQAMSLEEGSGQLNSALQQAIVHVQQKGIPIPQPPSSGYRGDMPTRLTDLDDAQLGDLLNDINQWCAYLDGEVSVAQTARDTADADLEFRKARIRMAIKAEGKKLTVQDKNDIMTTDPRIVEASARLLYCEAFYALTRAARNKAQQAWETVSRRITQRGQEVDRMRRENSVAGVPSAARAFKRPGQ